MDNRIIKSLGGNSLRINWRSPKKVNEVRDLAKKMYEDVSNAKDVDASDKILADYYKESSDIMFDFSEEVEADFWLDEDFPQGEFEYLQKLFMNPTSEM